MASFIARMTAHDRASEAAVGLIIALATRGTFRIAGGHDVDPFVLAAASLGASIAWGLVDAAIFVLAAKGTRLRWWHITTNSDPHSMVARKWAHEALEQTFLHNLSSSTRSGILNEIVAEGARAQPSNPRLRREDWLTGAAVFLVVVVAGLPAIAPLLLFSDADVGSWVSYGVAMLMLFALGAHWGPAHGLNRLRSGVAMLAIGACLTGLVIVLGG